MKEKKDKLTLREKIANATSIPKELMLNTVLISAIGNKELTLENYKSIIEYGDTCIRIKTNPNTVKIVGSSLEIRNISQDLLYITGTIQKIEYC